MSSKTSKTEIDGYIRKAVIRMLFLKLKTGTSHLDIRPFVAECVHEAEKLNAEEGATVGFDIHAIADVLRSWHTKTQFLTSEGLPKPLPIRGRLSVYRLVQMHFPGTKTESVVSTLKKSGLIVRSGRSSWLPAERHARIPKATTEIIGHLAEGVARLAETVVRNTQSGRGGDLLFERACKVFHLPLSDAASFREYVQKQGLLFITSVDDWLESRAVGSKKSRRDTCAAGAFGFAFIDDDKGPFNRRKLR
jgi:hypothetical protein